MSTITLPNIRVSSDLEIRLKLKDGGVAIDWSTLTNIKASIYSDRQRSLAGRCDIEIDEEDSTILVCRYSANKPQYPGVNRVIVCCTYDGETKTYDKPAFTFVRWTDDQAGQSITIDDPDIDVEITVEDVSSSILQEAVEAANSAAERANDAAAAAEHMVDIHTGPAGKSPYIGENGHWYEWDEETSQYVDTEEEAQGEPGVTPDITIGTVTTAEPGTPAAATMTGTPEAPVLNLTIPKGVAGDTPAFTVGEVTTGQPGTPVVVTITGTAAAPVLNIQIPQGMQGNTGSSVDYPYELVNNLTTNDATKGLSAAQGVVLDGKITQLEHKVDGVNDSLSGFEVHQVQTSSAVDTPSGTRLRIVRRVYPGFVVGGKCTAGKGMVATIYDTWENALKCPATFSQTFTNNSYTTSEWSGIVITGGWLSLSLCKSDSSAFSAQDKEDFLAATTATATFPGMDDAVGQLEEDVRLGNAESASFGIGSTYIKLSDGSFTAGTGYVLTNLFPLKDVESIDFTINSGSASVAVFGFYANLQASSFISGFGGKNMTYTGTIVKAAFPPTANYIAFSGLSSSNPTATLHYAKKVDTETERIDGKVGFLYKSYTEALYICRKSPGSGSAIDDPSGTRLRNIFVVPKGAFFKVSTTESSGVAVGLYSDLKNALLGNNSYTEIYTPSYAYYSEVHGTTGAAGYLSVSLTNGSTAITDSRKQEMLDALSVLIGYGMEGDLYKLSVSSGDGILSLNKDMDDALVSVGGVNAYASGTYDSFTTQKKNLSILAITDIHGTFESISRAVEFANAKTDFIDYVACLGDIVLRSPADSITDFEDSFADCAKPFLFTVGNHDTADTGLAAITEAEARTKYFSQIVSKGWISNFKDANSCSWYKDDSTHKIRMVSVFEYGNSQTVASGAPNTYCRRWIPSETLQWFADTLYSTPSDYSVVVLLHQIPFFPATYVEGKFTISSDMRISLSQFFLNTVDGNPFGDIVDAFINGSNLSESYDSISSYGLGKTATVAKDFTGRGAGKFICFVTGHFHGSYIFKDATYPDQITVVVPSGSQSAFQQKYGDTNYAPGTRNEDQFYVIGFDTENELINIAKIGGQVSNDMVKRDIVSIKY